MSSAAVLKCFYAVTDDRGRPMVGGVKKRKRTDTETTALELAELDVMVDPDAALRERKAARQARCEISAMLQPRLQKFDKLAPKPEPAPDAEPKAADDAVYFPSAIMGIAFTKRGFIALIRSTEGELFNEYLEAFTAAQGKENTLTLLAYLLEDAIVATETMAADSQDSSLLWCSPAPLEKTGAFAVCGEHGELYASENGLMGNGYDVFQQRIRGEILIKRCVQKEALEALINSAKNCVERVVLHPTEPCV